MEEMERQQFTFYRSFYEALKNLKNTDRLAVYDAVCAYALDGAEPSVTGVAATVFTLIRPVLDTGRKRAKTGKQGGKTEKASNKQNGSKSEANDKQTEMVPEDAQKQIEREKEVEIEKEEEKEVEIENECYKRAQSASRKQTRFTPPTVGEVAAYIRERGSSIDAQRFVDFYAARGWVYNGGQKMKDWRAAVRTWEQRDRQSAPQSMQHSTPDAGELARMQRLHEKIRGASDDVH